MRNNTLIRHNVIVIIYQAYRLVVFLSSDLQNSWILFTSNYSFLGMKTQALTGYVTWLRSIISPTCINAHTQQAIFYPFNTIHKLNIIRIESIKLC